MSLLNTISIRELLDKSLVEDLGIKGDITSNALITQEQKTAFRIIAKEDLIFCGFEIVNYFFKNYSKISYEMLIKDGEFIKNNYVIAEGIGNAKEILLVERTILNYLQHLSGIATLTRKYVDKIKGYSVKVCDTRKTIPLMRSLQKYAVTCGGGYNHRLTMDSSILIKDNHIAISGGITQAIKLARQASPHYAKIEIECDHFEQVIEAVECQVDIIMLDNMSVTIMEKSIKHIRDKAPNILINVSGSVSLDNIEDIAALGVDLISIGRITHSAPAKDISLDIV